MRPAGTAKERKEEGQLPPSTPSAGRPIRRRFAVIDCGLPIGETPVLLALAKRGAKCLTRRRVVQHCSV